MAKRIRPERIPTPPASARQSPCGVPGCLQTLPIDPAQADQPYLCPCPRRVRQEVFLDQRQGEPRWKLRAEALTLRPSKDAKEEYNLIAHALVSGQVLREGRRRVDTAPSESATRQSEAFLEAYRHFRQAALLLARGHAVAALDYAERGLAAEVAYDIHTSALRRELHQHQQGTLWQGGRVFWVDLPVRTAEGEMPPMRFSFEFLAVEGATEIEVLNGEDIERDSGVNVGVDGWRDLVRLLTRVEAKPGVESDPRYLIYRPQGELRPHARRYPRALIALEALRRSMKPLVKRQDQDAALAEWYGNWEAMSSEPEWVHDLLSQASTLPTGTPDPAEDAQPSPTPPSKYQQKRRARLEGDKAHG